MEIVTPAAGAPFSSTTFPWTFPVCAKLGIATNIAATRKPRILFVNFIEPSELLASGPPASHSWYAALAGPPTPLEKRNCSSCILRFCGVSDWIFYAHLLECPQPQ